MRLVAKAQECSARHSTILWLQQELMAANSALARVKEQSLSAQRHLAPVTARLRTELRRSSDEAMRLASQRDELAEKLAVLQAARQQAAEREAEQLCTALAGVRAECESARAAGVQEEAQVQEARAAIAATRAEAEAERTAMVEQRAARQEQCSAERVALELTFAQKWAAAVDAEDAAEEARGEIGRLQELKEQHDHSVQDAKRRTAALQQCEREAKKQCAKLDEELRAIEAQLREAEDARDVLVHIAAASRRRVTELVAFSVSISLLLHFLMPVFARWFSASATNS